jgi:type II secretion system protein N
MATILAPLKALLASHKLHMLYAAFFAVGFFFILFPSDDLSDMISSEINRGGQVNVRFDGLSLDPFSLGVSTGNLVFTPRGQPSIKAALVRVSPVLSRLLTFNKGVAAEIENIFSGNLHLEYGQDGKAKSGVPYDEISLSAEHLSLDEISGFLRSANLANFKLQGVARAEVANIRVDRLFAEQPSGTFSLDIQSFIVPTQTIMVNFNGVNVPQALPTLELGRVSLQNAKLSEGVLEIPELSIGEPKNELYGKLKGTLGLQLKKVGEQIYPEVSSVALTLKLIADKGFVERNQKTVLGGFFLLVPPRCKQETAKGTEITCLLKINRPGEPPVFEPLTEKI